MNVSLHSKNSTACKPFVFTMPMCLATARRMISAHHERSNCIRASYISTSDPLPRCKIVMQFQILSV